MMLFTIDIPMPSPLIDAWVKSGDDTQHRASVRLLGGRVYPVRPLQCRTYPFWPEVLASRQAWQREARRCEGINRGRAVPAGRIRRQLKCFG